MMKSFFYFSMLVLLFFSACITEDTVDIPVEEPPVVPVDTAIENTGVKLVANPIMLCALEVGQYSRYVFMTGDKYASPSDENIAYQTDTLVVEIVEQDTYGFKVKEYLTAGSTPHPDIYEPDTIFYFYFKVENGSLKVLPPPGTTFSLNRLFHYQFPTLNLSNIGTIQTAFFGWKTTLPYCECDTEAWCENCPLLGVNYDRLNIIRHDSDMQVDGPGFTWAYSAGAGLVRSTAVSWWTQTGFGWDLLPE